jgi:hypothetical protein
MRLSRDPEPEASCSGRAIGRRNQDSPHARTGFMDGGSVRARWTAAGTSDWGTDCRHAGELLADALNSRAPQIFDTIKDGDSERRVLNRDIAPYHDREMTVLCRDDRMAWLDMSRPECNLLHTLPPGSFRVSRASAAVVRSLRSRFDSVTAPHRPGRRSPLP